jgi:DNA-binding CsgD family transcriptional regulator
VKTAANDALLGALAPLHEAPQDPAAWNRALVALRSAIPCEQGALVERTGDHEHPCLGLVAGTDPRFVAEYEREFHRIDPFATEAVVTRLHELGRATLSAEVMRDVDLQGSDYYHHFLSRFGNLFHGVGGALSLGDRASAQIWLLRPRGRAFEEGDRARMDVFFAHARVALRQRRWLMQVERERNAALAWMDCWNDATFVLDARGAIVIANVMAEKLLHAGELFAVRHGRLVPGRCGEPDWLATALRSVLSAARAHDGHATHCLTLPARAEHPALHAVLTCLPCAAERGQAAQPNIALILRDLQQAIPRFSIEQLHDLFGFTAAESRVANALLAGQSVEDIAQRSQVRCDTVRAHVKRMLAKTGCRRQSDLQKLLVKALPNLRGLVVGDTA